MAASLRIGGYNVPDARGLTKEEIGELLAGPITARLATVTPEGAPYVVPIWQYWDGEAMWMIPRERSAFVEHIRQEPRVCVSCADEGPGHARVTIQGTAQIVEGPAKMTGRMLDIANDMVRRYMGPGGLKYLGNTADRPRYLIKIDPTRLTSWRGGEWHPRYFSE